MASKDLVQVTEYAAMQVESAQLLETLEANLGGQKLSEFDLDRVVIPTGGGKAWTVPTLEGEEVTPELQGIIVHWKDTRAYWRATFEEQGGGTPPDCSSPNAERASGDPTPPGAPPGNPQTPTDSDGLFICDACPNAQFGSDPRESSNAQACKLVRQLFLLTPGDLLPVVVSLPPTSVAAATRYFLRLSRRGLPYYSVVTKIALETAQSGGNIKYSKASFALAQLIDVDSAEKIKGIADALRPAFARSQVTTPQEVSA